MICTRVVPSFGCLLDAQIVLPGLLCELIFTEPLSWSLAVERVCATRRANEVPVFWYSHKFYGGRCGRRIVGELYARLNIFLRIW